MLFFYNNGIHWLPVHELIVFCTVKLKHIHFLVTNLLTMSVIRISDFWPVQTDLDFLGPFYFAKNVFLSIRKITLSDHLPY